MTPANGAGPTPASPAAALLTPGVIEFLKLTGPSALAAFLVYWIATSMTGKVDTLVTSMAAGMARQGEMQTRLEAIEVGIDQKLDRLEAFHGQQLAISREICASLAHDEPARARCYQAVLK